MEFIPKNTRKLSIVVSGSFRKHFSGISKTIEQFEALNIAVLSPKPSRIINPEHNFAILETGGIDDPRVLEQHHLNAIEKADALYIYNLDGYIGASVTLELGWAIALGKPVYSKEKSEDFTLKFFSGKVATPDEIKKELLERKNYLLKSVNDRSSVKKLQEYVHDVVVQRGFDEETPTDIMLLMVEEVGGACKSIKKICWFKN